MLVAVVNLEHNIVHPVGVRLPAEHRNGAFRRSKQLQCWVKSRV